MLFVTPHRHRLNQIVPPYWCVDSELYALIQRDTLDDHEKKKAQWVSPELRQRLSGQARQPVMKIISANWAIMLKRQHWITYCGVNTEILMKMASCEGKTRTQSFASSRRHRSS
jgi:hypothetical protein